MHKTPKINIGKGFQISASCAMKGATSPNTLDTVEQVPTA